MKAWHVLGVAAAVMGVLLLAGFPRLAEFASTYGGLAGDSGWPKGAQAFGLAWLGLLWIEVVTAVLFIMAWVGENFGETSEAQKPTSSAGAHH